MDIDDTRFKAVFENPLFNIDPSAPEFKKTQNMDTLVSEKVKRSEKKRKNRNTEKVDTSQTKKLKKDMTGTELVKSTDQSIDSLVKSVKSKTKLLEMKKNKKKL